MAHPIRLRPCPQCPGHLIVQASHRRKVAGYQGTYRLLKCRQCGHKAATHEVDAIALQPPDDQPEGQSCQPTA